MKKLTEKTNNSEEISDYDRIHISWGRQGGVIIGYVIIILGFFGSIANSMMFNQYGDWISYDSMDRTLLFWTYSSFSSQFLNQLVYFSILIVLLILIIVFSIIDWRSLVIIPILVVSFVIFATDLYWNLIKIIDVFRGNFYITASVISIILLFLVTFVLTYKEDIPQYGIKASLWMVPVIIIQGFFFYFFMFGFSIDPFILQFGSGQGYFNILILYLTVLSGSFSGMRMKKEINKRLDRDIENYT